MIAGHATAAQVEKTVRTYRSVLSADEEAEVATAEHMARYLRYEWADDGSLQGHFRIPADMAAILVKAVEAAHDLIHARIDPGRSRGRKAFPRNARVSFATTNCDALVMMAETLLATGPATRSDRFQIVVHADEDGHHISRRRTGPCGGDGAPPRMRHVDGGHGERRDRSTGSGRHEAPTDPLRDPPAVRPRDRGCRFQGCGHRVYTNIHHTRHRTNGGGNEVGNLVELCWFHHRLVHEGGWSVRLDESGEVIAIRPNGNVLPRYRPTGVDDRYGLERSNRQRGRTIDPTTCVPQWYGDHLDLDHIVTGLLAADGRLYPATAN